MTGKLFGGEGLKKACDMLFYLEQGQEDLPHQRSLRMDVSRYTPIMNITGLEINKKVGPYFYDPQEEQLL